MLFPSKPLATHWTFNIFTGFHVDKLYMSLPISKVAWLFATQKAHPGLAPETARICLLEVCCWVWVEFVLHIYIRLLTQNCSKWTIFLCSLYAFFLLNTFPQSKQGTLSETFKCWYFTCLLILVFSVLVYSHTEHWYLRLLPLNTCSNMFSTVAKKIIFIFLTKMSCFPYELSVHAQGN